jgi:hypothetical protein
LGQHRVEPAMRLVRLAVVAVVGVILAACGAAPAAGPASHAHAAGAEPAVVTAVAPVLHHRAIHSKADARVVASQALSLVAFPAGSVRLTVRPAAAVTTTGVRLGVNQVNATRWEAVHGTVTDLAAWLVAHPPAGTRVGSGAPGDGADLEWATAGAADDLPFSLSAWLATDGDHVDVTLSASVTWTPRKTAVETIPATVHSALLDYSEGNFTFGASSRHMVTGKDFDQIRSAINTLDTAVPGSPCPPNLAASTTVTMSYAGHRVVMQSDKCEDTSVVSDGHAQPALRGSISYLLTARLVASATVAPAQDVAPAGLLTELFSKAAAQQRSRTLARLVTLPRGVRTIADAGTPYPLPNVAVQSRAVAWAGPAASAVSYLSTHVAHGFVVAHGGPTPAGVTTVVLQPAHVYPASSLISVQVSRHGSSTVLRIDGESMWVTPRAAQELIPKGTATARVTIVPEQRPSKRVLLTGKAVLALTRALNSSKPARPLLPCWLAGRQLLKLEVRYSVGKHVVTFYWYNSDCVVGALVDGHRVTGLLDPPSALVERLLHWT